MKRVAIAGASGLIGSECLKILLKTSAILSVVSLVRRPTVTHPKLTELVVNFDNLEAEPAGETPIDTVFCCLGTTLKRAGSQSEFRKVDFDYVVALAQWGRRQKASHFLVVSSMGADPKASLFYSRTKGEMEEAVKTCGYASVDIFRPSLLLGDRKESRMGEKMGEAALGLLKPILVGKLRKYRAIQASVVASAMVQRGLRAEEGVAVLLSDKIQQWGA